MRKRYIVRLTPQERQDLLALAKRGKGVPSKIKHAQILLAAERACRGPERRRAERELDRRVARSRRVRASTSDRPSASLCTIASARSLVGTGDGTLVLRQLRRRSRATIPRRRCPATVIPREMLR